MSISGVSPMSTCIVLVLILLAGCAGGKHVTNCVELGDGANVNVDMGYFYDSMTLNLTGPAKWHKLSSEAVGNPCLGVVLTP